MSIDTIEPSAQEIADALRFFTAGDAGELRAIRELLGDEELGDLYRTVQHVPVGEWEAAIDRHPFASDSRKAKFHVAGWLWGGVVRLRWEDPLRFDPGNRAKFIRAMRVFVGLPPAELAEDIVRAERTE